ncbi:MAG: acyltransferase family protein [Muribaculaceae bacterium]|nr:acyltransferase family protein [Muribaculaceae bacterium]
MSSPARIIFLDYLRVIACFMVILVHSCEFYYLGDGGIVFRNPGDRLWVSVIDGALREAVPLFVMASSYLLVPLTMGTSAFFKRRFVRVFVPFSIWSVLYAVVPVLAGTADGSIGSRLARLLYTFNDDSGHLWFIYMLIGVYLTMPVISPWLAQVSKRGEQAFLVLWFVSTFWGYLQPALGDVWGKALWNDFHALYYYSGFIGYVVLAHYIREHVHWSTARCLAVGLPLIAVGYAVTAGLFYQHSGVSSDYAYGEQSWNFCTFNVAMTTAGCFLIMRKINCTAPWLYRPVAWVSRASYGIYLMHIFVLGWMYSLISPALSCAPAIFAIAASTFAACIAICALLRLIPGNKWIIG